MSARTVGPLPLLVVGVALVAGGVWFGLVAASSGASDAAAYGSATPCAGGVPAAAPATCYVDAPARVTAYRVGVVTDRTIKGDGQAGNDSGVTDTMDVVLRDGTTYHSSIHRLSWDQHLSTGDSATVHIWRGDMITITARGTTWTTKDQPASAAILQRVWGLVAIAIGVFVLIAAGSEWQERRFAGIGTRKRRKQMAIIWTEVWPGVVTNSRMQRLMAACGAGSDTLDSDLQRVVDGGVTVTDRLIYWTVFTTNVPEQLDPPPPELIDLTGVECHVNETRMFDPNSGEQGECHYLQQGMLLADALERLTPAISTPPIRVILTINGSSSTFRFHQIRDGEHWLAADLEGYPDEAVATWVIPRH